MNRWLLLVAAVGAVGCASEGAKEASGDTSSIAKDVPKSQPGAPHFTPPGHSLMKESPGGKKGGATATAPPKPDDTKAPAGK